VERRCNLSSRPVHGANTILENDIKVARCFVAALRFENEADVLGDLVVFRLLENLLPLDYDDGLLGRLRFVGRLLQIDVAISPLIANVERKKWMRLCRRLLRLPEREAAREKDRDYATCQNCLFHRNAHLGCLDGSSSFYGNTHLSR